MYQFLFFTLEGGQVYEGCEYVCVYLEEGW